MILILCLKFVFPSCAMCATLKLEAQQKYFILLESGSDLERYSKQGQVVDDIFGDAEREMLA